MVRLYEKYLYYKHKLSEAALEPLQYYKFQSLNKFAYKLSWDCG